MPEMPPRSPEMAQDESKTAQDARKMGQDVRQQTRYSGTGWPKIAKNGSSWTSTSQMQRYGLPQDGPKWLQIHPNKPDKAAWAGPKWLKIDPKKPDGPPEMAQDGPREAR